MTQKFITATEILKTLKVLGTTERMASHARFFKTGPGEYAEGDQFFGVTVPQLRTILRSCELPLPEQVKLLKSPWHEARLLALLHMVKSYKYADEKGKEKIHKSYLTHTQYINNWDLIDSSAEYVVGAYLFQRSRALLGRMAKSKSLWERRIAVLACFHFIKQGEIADILKLATLLLNDKEDLIHKAVGWMLREMGGRGNMPSLLGFLDEYANRMPRTMLRYAIEKLPETKRQHYLKLSRLAKDK
jgi:3-methyladenine DNA glycosylase AlkD